jgi:small subunit ribosomal protein S6
MNTRDYEAMFLLNNDAATADFDAASGQVDKILEKNGVKIVRKEKWDERKLAYEIRGHKRATYYLLYFRAPTTAIDPIRADATLNEKIIRHLVVSLEEPIEIHVKKRAEERERLAEESRKASLAAGWGGPGEERRRHRDDGEPGADDIPDLVVPPDALDEA